MFAKLSLYHVVAVSCLLAFFAWLLVVNPAVDLIRRRFRLTQQQQMKIGFIVAAFIAAGLLLSAAVIYGIRWRTGQPLYYPDDPAEAVGLPY